VNKDFQKKRKEYKFMGKCEGLQHTCRAA